MNAPSQWTREEFREWLDTKLTSEADKKRWTLASARLLKGLPVPPDALLSETILRALAGTRNFNREHPIEANLHEAMRSIASSWHKAHKRKPEISFDDLIGTDSDVQDPLEVFLVPDGVQASAEDDCDDPLAAVAHKTCFASDQWCVPHLQAALKRDHFEVDVFRAVDEAFRKQFFRTSHVG